MILNNDDYDDYDDYLDIMYKQNNKNKQTQTNKKNKYCLGHPYLNHCIIIPTNNNGTIYGSYINTQITPYYTIDMIINLNFFYFWSYSDLYQFVEEYSLSLQLIHSIEIMKKVSYIKETNPLDIHNKIIHNTTNLTHKIKHVILYTYWIRLIQRHWKNQYNNNKQIKEQLLKKQYSLQYRLINELRGNINQQVLPGLVGLLSVYNHK